MNNEPAGEKIAGAKSTDVERAKGMDATGERENPAPTRMTGRFKPACLGLAPLLAVFPFIDRISNGYLTSFDAADPSSSFFAVAFITSIFATIAVMGVITFLLTFKKVVVFGRTASIAVGVLAGVAGFVLGCVVPTLAGGIPYLLADIVAGVLVGVSLSLLVGSWGLAYAPLTPSGILVHTSVSLLITSGLWVVGVSMSAQALCVLLCAYVVLSGTILFLYLRLSLHAAGVVDLSAPVDDGSVQEDERRVEPQRETGNGRAAVSFLWVSVAGLMFSFLTSGMTLTPEQAGTPSLISTFSKVAAYAVTAIIILAMVLWRRKTSEFDLDVFYKTVLPLAAAILLVFPYLDLSMGTFANAVIGIAGYMGFSLFNVLSFAALAMVYKVCRYSVERAFSAAMVLASLALIVGIQVYAAIGSGGQTVSMCLQAAYLVAMTISAIRGGIVNHPTVVVVEPAPQETDDLSAKCDAVAKQFGLSAREAEIVQYIARGRGAAHIADALCISPETVRTHTKRIYDKTGVHKREELIDLINGR